MGFQVSPGVNVSEIDLTTIIPAVSTTTGAFAGHFNWGPVGQRVLVDSEDTLSKQFGIPNTNTAVDFFSAANFLAYGNALYTVRVINESGTASSNTARGRNAIANAANNTNTIIKNEDEYNANYSSGISGVGAWVAKYPGVLGNNLRVSVCLSSNAYERTLTGGLSVSNNSVTVTGVGTLFTTQVAKGDILLLGPDRLQCKVTAITNTTSLVLSSAYVGNTVSGQTSVTRRWEYYDYVPSAPGTSFEAAKYGGSNDEMHIVVVDSKGGITGTPDTILEVFPSLSKAASAHSENGTSIHYRNHINQNSRWLWWAAYLSGINTRTVTQAVNHNSGAGTTNLPLNYTMANGRDGASPRPADYINGYNLFKSAESVDISLIIGGGQSTSTVPVHIINNIAEYRKDCVAVFSPRQADVVNNSGYAGAEVDDIIAFRNSLPSTSYAVIDSGWKYQYDKYSDVFRYVPCNGDTAGTMVRTDIDRDPWYSPAGYNRGQIKNVVKLAFNPNKTERDALYKAGINPIVTFPGEGTILFGDKTMLTKPSAFDRINVRRLFIVLEKAISTAAKYTLFEFNDAFTRAQFKALVEPFLRDVQGRRGITDFRVVCDETNNTPEVIDRNEFIGDIYIKPARSINFIQLNFVAVRTGVDFTEVVGKF
jgi:phage tail sheath protein FI